MWRSAEPQRSGGGSTDREFSPGADDYDEALFLLVPLAASASTPRLPSGGSPPLQQLWHLLGRNRQLPGAGGSAEEIRRGYWSLKHSGAGVSVRVVLPGRPGHSYINRGELLGDIDAALQDLGEAVRRLEDLKVKYPSRHDYRYRLGVAYHDQGEIRGSGATGKRADRAGGGGRPATPAGRRLSPPPALSAGTRHLPQQSRHSRGKG